jgi:hypothetical protein
MIKKIDVRKIVPKKEEAEEVYTEYLDNYGAWEKVPPRKLSMWDNYVEVDMFDRYEHRYFFVWNDGNKPQWKRVKKKNKEEKNDKEN